MTVKPVQAYVGTVATLALVALVAADWGQVIWLSDHALAGFLVFMLLGLFLEGSAFSYKLGESGGSSSLVFLPLLACALLFGPSAALVFVAVTGSAVECFIRRKQRIKIIFNVSQYLVAAWIGGLAFSAAGGHPLAMAEPGSPFDPQAPALFAFATAFFLLNHGLVAGAIAAASSQPFVKVARSVVGRVGGALALDFLALPIAILVAFLYFELGIPGLALSLLPLAFIRYSYRSKFELETANRDLLAALVKAIETRDPYTSGHSVRVQELAESIGRALGMPERTLAELRRSALLHDIGKIEVAYEQILRKPSALSTEERAVIESHVTRGVAILNSLSSFKAKVIEGVKHHHESFDGTGYPDGLIGLEIPLFARVIKVCDAIDAMLSTRPYRDALGVREVEMELERCSGLQFDPRLVAVVLTSRMVAEHHRRMALSLASQPSLEKDLAYPPLYRSKGDNGRPHSNPSPSTPFSDA